MDNQADIESPLKLEKLVFEEILFNRQGFKNKNEVNFTIEVQVGEDKSNNIYKVTICICGDKQDEYKFSVKLAGFFSIVEESLDKKNILLNQNAVAILMPYVRSQITILTAQPETECVILPTFNIIKLMKENK